MIATELRQVVETRYRLCEPISRGSFAWVYRGECLRDGMPVAIKLFCGQPELFATSLNELRLLFRLRHPHIVKILDLFYLRQSYALVFEYLEDGDLRQLIELGELGELGKIGRSRLSEADILLLGAQIADGLSSIHAQGIVHQDLKPENILLRRRPEGLVCKIADFNVSRLRAQAAAGRNNEGSPLYMAPELFFNAYDHRVDYYALGVVLFELLAGRPPFEGSLEALMRQHLHAPPPLELCLATPATRALLAELLAKQPAERPTNALVLRDRLLQLSQAETRLNPWDELKQEDAFYLKYLDQSLQLALLGQRQILPEERLSYLQQRNYLNLVQKLSSSSLSDSSV